MRDEEGKGVGKDQAQALHWFRKASELGHPAAANSIGAMYEEGRGVEQDSQQALEWYRLSAQRGYGIARARLTVVRSNII